MIRIRSRARGRGGTRGASSCGRRPNMPPSQPGTPDSRAFVPSLRPSISPMVADMERVIVAGGGLAAVRTAEALRARGFAGRLTIVGAEQHRPYDRPPLSKAVLRGETDDTTVD